jgi:hypothetical protein
MPRRITEVVILVEDICQANFVRHYLAKAGITSSPRIKNSPKGRGSGAQFVLDNYAVEVRTHRRQSSRLSAALIAVIDADNVSVDQRRKGLAKKLDDAGIRRAHRRPPGPALRSRGCRPPELWFRPSHCGISRHSVIW